MRVSFAARFDPGFGPWVFLGLPLPERGRLAKRTDLGQLPNRSSFLFPRNALTTSIRIGLSGVSDGTSPAEGICGIGLSGGIKPNATADRHLSGIVSRGSRVCDKCLRIVHEELTTGFGIVPRDVSNERGSKKEEEDGAECEAAERGQPGPPPRRHPPRLPTIEQSDGNDGNYRHDDRQPYGEEPRAAISANKAVSSFTFHDSRRVGTAHRNSRWAVPTLPSLAANPGPDGLPTSDNK